MIQTANELFLSMGLLFVCIHYMFICPSLLAVFQKTKEKLFAQVKKKKHNSIFLSKDNHVSPSESRHVVETGLFISCETRGRLGFKKTKQNTHGGPVFGQQKFCSC